MDAGIFVVERLDGAFASSRKDNRGVAEAGKARPGTGQAAIGVDDGVGERHRRAVGDGHLVVAGERAVDDRAVLCRRVARQRREVAVPRRVFHYGARGIAVIVVQRGIDGDGAAIAVEPCTDRLDHETLDIDRAARGDNARDFRANRNVAAIRPVAAADARAPEAAVRDDSTARNHDIAAVQVNGTVAVASADAGGPAVAAVDVRRQRAGSLDGQRHVRRHVDARIEVVECLDGVFAEKNDRGIAFAREAREASLKGTVGVDDGIRDRHRRAVGDRHLVAAAKRAVDDRAVARRRVMVERREVAVPWKLGRNEARRAAVVVVQRGCDGDAVACRATLRADWSCRPGSAYCRYAGRGGRIGDDGNDAAAACVEPTADASRIRAAVRHNHPGIEGDRAAGAAFAIAAADTRATGAAGRGHLRFRTNNHDIAATAALSATADTRTVDTAGRCHRRPAVGARRNTADIDVATLAIM